MQILAKGLEGLLVQPIVFAEKSTKAPADQGTGGR
jgi:hypothetical protein